MEQLYLDDFTKYKFLSGLKFSPDGRNIGFIKHTINVEENKYLSYIYVQNNQTSSLKKLTSLGEERSFTWKDKETLIFPRIIDKKDKERKEEGKRFTSYYEININGGEANKAFEIPLQVGNIVFVDHNTILLTAEYNPMSEEEVKENKDFEVLDEIPFWSNGEGYSNKKRTRLYLFNIQTQVLNPITDEFTDVYSFKLNKDKTMAIIITNSFIDKRYLKTDMHLYNILEDNINKISPIEEFNYSYADFLEDKIIFVGKDMKSYGMNENPHFYISDLDSSFVSRISSDDFDFSTYNSIGSDCRYGGSNTMKVDGDYLYFVTTEGDSSFINRIDTKGKMDKLTNKKGSIDGLDVYNGEINFIGLRSLKLQELYSLNEFVEEQLTDFNEWVMKEKTLSIPEKLTFKTEDHTLIEGWVLKPTNYKPGEKYPAILDIHGGPKTAYGEVFYHEMQYWANEGYAVFFCNPRGSDGRGNEFADIRGKYGTIDYDDIMRFTDLVLEKYDFIDKDRIGVTGGSYGGFMTNWIIGHTNRFKAAASQRSISNWISKFGTTDIGYYFVDDQIAATPWSDFDKLWNHSPMKYADRVTTPTLFIHSEEDYRCWLPEGIQMFTSLKYHGVESRLCMFRGENHELSRSGKPKSRIKRLKEITEWFDKYLK
ncbi:MAG: S9 family peptidase [Tissierellaceae bacterium]|nr:S9 family peptidase [Tissierellaceae bacterium]